MEFDPSKFTWRNLSFVFALLCFVIAPGFLLIFLSDESLFESVDFLKLLALASSITLPFWLLLNMIVFTGLYMGVKLKMSEDKKKTTILSSSVISALYTIFFIALLILLKLQNKISFHLNYREPIIYFIIILITAVLSSFLIAGIADSDGVFRRKKKSVVIADSKNTDAK